MRKEIANILIVVAALIGLVVIVFVIGLLSTVSGCKDEQPLSEWHWDTIIEEKRAEGYYISEINFKEKIDKGWRTTKDGTIEIYKDGIALTGENFVAEPNEPCEHSNMSKRALCCVDCDRCFCNKCISPEDRQKMFKENEK